MPRGTRGSQSRGDITQTVEQRDQEYREKTDVLEHHADDFRVECDAIEGMDGLGTLEGMEAVTASLQEAKETSEQEFSSDGNELEHTEEEGREFEGELNERHESNESDLEKLGDARQQLRSEAAAARVEQAEGQAREDSEFLRGEEERSRQSRETAEQQYEQLKQIVHGTGA